MDSRRTGPVRLVQGEVASDSLMASAENGNPRFIGQLPGHLPIDSAGHWRAPAALGKTGSDRKSRGARGKHKGPGAATRASNRVLGPKLPKDRPNSSSRNSRTGRARTFALLGKSDWPPEQPAPIPDTEQHGAEPEQRPRRGLRDRDEVEGIGKNKPTVRGGIPEVRPGI